MVRTGNGFARKGNSPACRSLGPLDCPRDDEVGHAEALAEVAGEDPRQGALSRSYRRDEQCCPEGIHNGVDTAASAAVPECPQSPGRFPAAAPADSAPEGDYGFPWSQSRGSLAWAGSEAPRGFWTSLAAHLRKQSGSALESPSRRNRKADVLAG
jgi:hypothetical protein